MIKIPLNKTVSLRSSSQIFCKNSHFHFAHISVLHFWRAVESAEYIIAWFKTIQMTTQHTQGKLSFAYAFMNTADKTWAGGFARQGNRNSRVKTNSECAWTSSPCFVSTRQVKITSFMFLYCMWVSQIWRSSAVTIPRNILVDRINLIFDFSLITWLILTISLGFLRLWALNARITCRRQDSSQHYCCLGYRKQKWLRFRAFDIRVLF